MNLLIHLLVVFGLGLSLSSGKSVIKFKIPVQALKYFKKIKQTYVKIQNHGDRPFQDVEYVPSEIQTHHEMEDFRIKAKPKPRPTQRPTPRPTTRPTTRPTPRTTPRPTQTSTTKPTEKPRQDSEESTIDKILEIVEKGTELGHDIIDLITIFEESEINVHDDSTVLDSIANNKRIFKDKIDV